MSTRRARTVVAAAALGVLLAAAPALADEQESTQAPVLVQQALSLLANDNAPQLVLERVRDAARAPSTDGVDLGAVEEAARELEPVAQRGDSAVPDGVARQVRAALERSLGTAAQERPASMSTGTQTGTTVVLDEYTPARGVSGTGDAVLLALSAAAIAGGLVTARRLRPAHSLRSLRAGGAPTAGPATAPADLPADRPTTVPTQKETGA